MRKDRDINLQNYRNVTGDIMIYNKNNYVCVEK